VDVIYVATPHIFHKENCRLCLNAGKSVLCEKAFAINAKEATEMIRLAHERRLFLMEAMWTRFLPILAKLRELLAARVIGEVQTLIADLGFRADFNPRSRLFAPELGGGALLDVGVYPISLASMIFGKPVQITGAAQTGATGVDEHSAMILRYPTGQLALLHATLRTNPEGGGVILGTNGRIKIHPPLYQPSGLTVSVKDQADRVIPAEIQGNGYQFEANEVMQCLREGRSESSLMPLHETLTIMETMDELRSQWGLRYPTE